MPMTVKPLKVNKKRPKSAVFVRLPAVFKSLRMMRFHPAVMSRSGARDLFEVHLQARAHRRGNAEFLDELALRARRLVADDRIHERPEVLGEVCLGERRLADAGVDDSRLFDAELDLARLGVVDGLGDVHG